MSEPKLESVLADIQAAKALALDAKTTSDRAADERGYLESMILKQQTMLLLPIWCGDDARFNPTDPALVRRVETGVANSARLQEDPLEAMYYYQLVDPDMDEVLFGAEDVGGWVESFALYFPRYQTVLALLTAMKERLRGHDLYPMFLERFSRQGCGTVCASPSRCGSPTVLCVRSVRNFNKLGESNEFRPDLYKVFEILRGLKHDLDVHHAPTEEMITREAHGPDIPWLMFGGRATDGGEAKTLDHTSDVMSIAPDCIGGTGPDWFFPAVLLKRFNADVDSSDLRPEAYFQTALRIERMLAHWLAPFVQIAFPHSPDARHNFRSWVEYHCPEEAHRGEAASRKNPAWTKAPE